MKRGFTLIEIMVAVSIFAIVAVITTGALVTASEVNRKAQAIKIAMDNVSFAMDSMVFNLREGGDFGCGTGSANLLDNCNGGDHLVFRSKRNNANDEIIRYRFEDSTGLGKIQIARGGVADYTDITSTEVDIEDVRFYVPSSAGRKTKAVIVIKGQVPGKTTTEFNLQTTVKANY
ncbi:MAG: type II secretion system protein [Candidatus Vogelbacteria bacterium]|nr:type II secretion system protein [Candidatus Vogelbacteria bacterium]